MTPLKIRTVSEQSELIREYLNQRATMQDLNILEAGCGRKWHYKLDPARHKLTGVDMDAAALAVRKNEEKDLDEAILADLRSVQLAPNSYDVIFNAYVLEHIDGAEKVLSNFMQWLKPGGALVIHIPDPSSAYGFFAHHTPHWMHVFFYRHILGNRDAGKPGHVPYPTFYDSVVSRKGIREFVNAYGLLIREECGFYKPPGVASYFLDVIHLLSFGMLAGSHCNLLYIIEKPSLETSGQS